MSWIELRAVVPRTRMDDLSDLAFVNGASGVQEAPAPGTPLRFRQPWDTEDPPLPMFVTFRAWFSEEDAEAAEAAFTEADSELTFERLTVNEEDWAESWKIHHHRIVISDRLRVSPPWEAVPGDLVIPPGQAFGTGDHPTTLACLSAIDRLAGECRTCLDVGSGSGVLALAAVKLGMKAVGVDNDPECVRTAKENAAENELEAHFSDTELPALRGPYDLVVANLYAEVLVGMAPELIRLTGRHLVLAGILADRADKVVEALSPPLALTARVQEGDWVSLHLVKLAEERG